jgi:hypothetical protein
MRLLTTAAIFLATAFPAQAGHRHHHHHHHHSHHQYAERGHAHAHGTRHTRHHAVEPHQRKRVRVRRPRDNGYASSIPHGGGGIVTIATAAGPITVAAHLANRFQALIADFVAAGYKPRAIGCYAHGGHVPNSRHYSGAACDFDQRGWGLTTSFMYRARAIIAKHGFRDGCSFNDCGHVDDGQPLRNARRSWNDDNG